MKMRLVGAELFHASGRPYMTKQKVSLQNFQNAPNIGYDDPVTCNRVMMERSDKNKRYVQCL